MTNRARMSPRDQIQSVLGANKDLVAANLNDFWRNWAEDLVIAGVDKHEVVETMLVVAMSQCVGIAGTTATANYLERCAAKMFVSADAGVEFPFKKEAQH